MKLKPQKYNRGFIKAILIVALVLLILKFAFQIDPFDILRHKNVEPFLKDSLAWLMHFWNTYAFPVVNWIIDKVIWAWGYVDAFARIAWAKILELARGMHIG
ncbi:hypothetical protein H7X65_01605 [Candidatus Parcubacteria bacterium]|nr:hypothetical protein [Candidatus Parcubacteria bacterium]